MSVITNQKFLSPVTDSFSVIQPSETSPVNLYVTMNNPDQYFKKLQRDGIYHYAHLMATLNPPVCDVVNSLSANPIIEHREYDRSKPVDRIDLKAFSEDWSEITSVEYKRAFDEATSGDFQVCINGKLQV